MLLRIKKNIPNAITCGNLFCGCVGIAFAFQHQLLYAAFALFAGAAFDFFDGLAARLLKVSSEIGKQLDSLADVVSFGVLPGAIIFELLANVLNAQNTLWSFAAFLIPVFSAIRLAKFNIDERQDESFIGLPTPASGILAASFPLALWQGNELLIPIIINPLFLLGYIVVICALLVAELPLMSLKFKDLSIGHNFYRYLLIALSVIMIVIFKFAAFPVVILIYIGLSIIQIRFSK